MQYQKVLKAAAVLAILVFIVIILVYAKPFLVPLTFGALLSMLLLPITKWLEAKGANKTIAITLSILVLVSFFALVIFFVGWQISDIANNASNMEKQLTSKYQQITQLISQKLGIPPEKQQQMMKQQQSSSGGMSSTVMGFLTGLGSLLANIVLVLVYIFLFIFFRGRLKGFIVRLVPKDEEAKALDTIDKAQGVAQKYLSGLSLMIVFLWVMYTIGFSIAGVKNAFFFAIICGLLEIVPFVGNVTGTLLTLAMSMAQGGSMNVVIGILITYGLVQFIQTYILEPLVVGAEVNINPLFTIIGLVIGELVWGIAGMVLAIPLIGIAKIVCDHVEPLKPFGYLIGDDKKKDDNTIKKKVKEFAEKLKAKLK